MKLSELFRRNRKPSPSSTETTHILAHSVPGIGTIPVQYDIPLDTDAFMARVEQEASTFLDRCDLALINASYFDKTIDTWIQQAIHEDLDSQLSSHTRVIFWIKEEQEANLKDCERELARLTAFFERNKKELEELDHV